MVENLLLLQLLAFSVDIFAGNLIVCKNCTGFENLQHLCRQIQKINQRFDQKISFAA